MSRLGWFRIDGMQDGPRTLEEQLTGLGPLICEAKGKAVLDLGCAEGLIAQTFIRAGARLAHGVDCNAELFQAGKRAAPDVAFMQADLRKPGDVAALPLLPRYEIVLALSILHKMTEPPDLLSFAAARCSTWLAIRLPAKAFRDRRSGFREFDVPALLAGEFDLMAEPDGPRSEWVGLFRRR